MGVSTAIFSSAQKTNINAPGFHSGDPIRPYSATFWFCTAAAGASLFLVPWLTIGTQGHRVRKDDVDVGSPISGGGEEVVGEKEVKT
jgi:hypothetical protein